MLIRVCIIFTMSIFTSVLLAEPIRFYGTQCRNEGGNYECQVILQERQDANLKGDGCILGTGLKLSANADEPYKKKQWNSVVYIKKLVITKAIETPGSRVDSLFLPGKLCDSNIKSYPSRDVSLDEIRDYLTTLDSLSESSIRHKIKNMPENYKYSEEIQISFQAVEYKVGKNLKYIVISVVGKSFSDKYSSPTFERHILRVADNEKSIIWSWVRPELLFYNSLKRSIVMGIFEIDKRIYYLSSVEEGAHDSFLSLREDKAASAILNY